MIRPNCQNRIELAQADHRQFYEVEKKIWSAMNELALLLQYVPINACSDIRKVGIKLGEAYKLNHAIDCALEFYDMTETSDDYVYERDREFRETPPGEFYWKEAVDNAIRIARNAR